MHLCVKIYECYVTMPACSTPLSGWNLKKRKKEKKWNYSFFDIWPKLQKFKQCVWLEQQSHLWCVKFEKHILLFSTLKGLGARCPIHQNISKKGFWWNFEVKGAVWLGQWWAEAKKTWFNWCFNALEFSPQKPARKHETMQSVCKFMAYINPIKSWDIGALCLLSGSFV